MSGALPDEESPTLAATFPAAGMEAPAAETLARELKIGRYADAQRQLGVGGMGKVHEVLEKPLGRPVAMKLMLAPESVRDQERFIREARITGQLEHPSIVPVHELNVDHRGRLFYTMKLLRGVTLAHVLEELAAGTPDALKGYDLPALLIIYQKLCDAIAFAHSRNPAVIHRDLKPENIMVGEYGEVQVMDWGLAKILGTAESPAAQAGDAGREAAVVAATPSSQEVEAAPPPLSVEENAIAIELGLTLEGEIMGTPAYMPPEQARGDINSQDERTDIYALGSILYAILFLKPPLELTENETQQLRHERRFGEEAARTLWRGLSKTLSERIQRGELAFAVRKGGRLPKLRYPPGTAVPDSLAAVIRKAIALDPTQRYASVLDLQADVAAYQQGFATKAEDAGAWRHFLLFVRRHRAVSAATASALFLIALLSIGFVVTVTRERDRTEASNVELQNTLTNASFADLEAARHSFRKGESRAGCALLGRALVYDPKNQAASDYLLSALVGGGGDFDLLPRFGVFHSGAVTSGDFSPDGRYFVTAGYDHTAHIWETSNGKPVGAPMKHASPLSSIKFSPDGRWLLTTGEDGFARLWNAESGGPIGQPMQHGNVVETGVFSPDGRLVLTGSWDGFARLWNADTCEEIRRFPHAGNVGMAFFDADASRVLTASWDHTAQVWSTATGEKIGAAIRHGATIRRAFFSPDGARIVTACLDGTARIWDANTGVPVSAPLVHQGFVWTVAISPDGRLLATASHDSQARLWKMEDGAAVGQPMQHGAPLESIAFSSDGARLLTASRDSTVRLWNGTTGEPLGRVMRHDNSLLGAIFSPDGQQVLSFGWDNAAYLWETKPAPSAGKLLPIPSAVLQAEFTSDPDLLFLALGNHTARFWSLKEKRYVGPAFDHGAALIKVRVSPDGNSIATVGEDMMVRFWSRQSGERLGATVTHNGRIFDTLFARDGATFFTGGADGQLREWSVPAGKPMRSPLAYPAEIHALALSPDGHEIAVGGRDYFISRYDLRREGPPDRQIRLDEYAVALSYSLDGTKLATGSERRSARIWKLTSEPASTVHFIVEGKASSLTWSGDGTRLLVAGSEDSYVYCYSADSSALALEPYPHGTGVAQIATSGEGAQILSVGTDGKVKLWPTSAPIPPPDWLRDYLRAACGMAFSREQQLVQVPMSERLSLRARLLAAEAPDSAWREVLERSFVPAH